MSGKYYDEILKAASAKLSNIVRWEMFVLNRLPCELLVEISENSDLISADCIAYETVTVLVPDREVRLHVGLVRIVPMESGFDEFAVILLPNDDMKYCCLSIANNGNMSAGENCTQETESVGRRKKIWMDLHTEGPWLRERFGMDFLKSDNVLLIVDMADGMHEMLAECLEYGDPLPGEESLHAFVIDRGSLVLLLGLIGYSDSAKMLKTADPCVYSAVVAAHGDISIIEYRK